MTTTTLRLRGTDAREDFDRGPGIMRRGLAMRAEDLLDHAAWVVRHRRRTYGQPNDVFGHVAKRWSLVLGIDVTPAQAIPCLIDLKVARLAHDLKHLDSITDIAGYAGCLAEVSR